MPGPILNAALALAQQQGAQAGTGPDSHAPAPPHEEAKWPYAALALGQLADVGTTIAAVESGKFRETNPMGYGGTIAAKAAVGTALALLMHHEAKQGNDHMQKLIGVIGGAMGVGPALWNIAQMAKAQQ